MFPIRPIPHFKSITTVSVECIAEATSASLTSFTSGVWATANRAYFYPFHLQYPLVVAQLLAANGAANNGNLDIGIYSAGSGGPEKLMVSAGSTAQAGTDTVQAITVSALTLGAGDYYFALVMDNTTGTIYRASPNLAALRHAGVYQQSTAFPLPATATPIAITTALSYLAGVEFTS